MLLIAQTVLTRHAETLHVVSAILRSNSTLASQRAGIGAVAVVSAGGKLIGNFSVSELR